MSVCVPMYTNSGEAHGKINVLTNSVVNDDFKHMAPETKAKAQKEKKEDGRIVKVEWHLIPGHVYELPMGFVKEVNGTKMPTRSGLVSLDGKDLNKDGSPLDKDSDGEQIHRLFPVSF